MSLIIFLTSPLLLIYLHSKFQELEEIILKMQYEIDAGAERFTEHSKATVNSLNNLEKRIKPDANI